MEALMILPHGEIWITLFLVAAMVFTVRCRKYLKSVDNQSYNYICSGLVILSLVSLARVYYSFGAFSEMPFVSEALFFRLLNWIGVITGVIFLVSGISCFLPLSRINQENNERRVMRFGLIRKVEQLVAFESRLKVIFERVLSLMIGHYDFNYGAVYAFSRRRNGLCFLSSCYGKGPFQPKLDKITFNKKALAFLTLDNFISEEFLKNWDNSIKKPLLILPVFVRKQIAGIFLLWGENVAVNEDDLQNLKIAADIIGRQILLKREQAKLNYLSERINSYRTLASGIDYKKGIAGNILLMARKFRAIIPFEFLSLSVIDSQQRIDRFSVGRNGTLLNEKGLSYNSFSEQVKNLFDDKKPLIINDLNDEEIYRKFDKIIINNGIKSLLAVPLYHDDRLEAVLALASNERCGFGQIDSFSLEFMSEVITGLLVEERYRGKVRTKEQCHARLNGFLLDASRIENMQVLFERAATIISDHLQTTMVRIADYESTGSFLDSKAMVLQKPLDGVIPSYGHLVLDLMPYHKLVRDTGRVMMINQENTDKKISEAECSQAFFPGLKSALLVPIKIDEKVLGVISLAEERSWESFQFQQTDILYVTSIASVLALAFLKSGIVTSHDKKSDGATPRKLFKGNDKQGSYPFLQDQLNTSMSGVFNSVETMRSRLGLSETTNGDCPTDIDRSADNIRRCTQDNIPI